MSVLASWARLRHAWQNWHPFKKDPLAPLVETARRLEYGAGPQPHDCCTDAVSDRGDTAR
ncbi:hypothetical protein [Streptomyces sp. NPDC001536]|uniref:hypothetical protein n=1 Tax=Streptomyces sp. NPDC001536 TaxID=3364583 RepID=UPI0036CD2008